MIRNCIYIFSIATIIIVVSCDQNSLSANKLSKSICLMFSTTDSVAPLPPYMGEVTHYDYYAGRSFLIDNNVIHITNKKLTDSIDYIHLIIILSFEKKGIHSGSTSGDTYVANFPYILTYGSEFWKEKGKAVEIEFDSITKSGDVYYTFLDKPSVLKPGNTLILKDTLYDTIRDTFSGSNAVIYAHQHIKIDSIFNYGYLPFE